ncbi:MAG: YlmC/YmxH family sporulation protein [Bacillota bacterium]
MFKISELARRDIVNLADGAKLGAVKDVHIDPSTGTVLAIVLEGPRRFGLLSAGRDTLVPWSKIKKIGVHTVLVDLEAAHRTG